MRHLNSGNKLGQGPDRRRALLRSMTLALIERPQIRITIARAKALRWHADHVVTLAKRGDVHGRRQIISLLGCSKTGNGENRVRTVIDKVYTDLAPRFKTRPGGYTQIFRLGERRPGDNAEMCIMRYIPGEEDAKGSKKTTKKDPNKKTTDKKKLAAEAAPKEKKSAKAAAAPEDKPEKAKAKKPKDK